MAERYSLKEISEFQLILSWTAEPEGGFLFVKDELIKFLRESRPLLL